MYLGLDMSTGGLMAVEEIELPKGSSVDEDRKRMMIHALEMEITVLKELEHPNLVKYIGKHVQVTTTSLMRQTDKFNHSRLYEGRR